MLTRRRKIFRRKEKENKPKRDGKKRMEINVKKRGFKEHKKRNSISGKRIRSDS